LKLDLSFLATNKQYQITIIKVGINANHWAEDYKKVTMTLTSEDILDMDMAPTGGYTAGISPL
jgi:hypothetical protein